MPKPLDFTWFPTKLKQRAEFEQNMTLSHLIMKRSRSVLKSHCTDYYLSLRCCFFCRSQCTRSLRPTSCKWKRRPSTSSQVNRRQETSLYSISSSEWHTSFYSSSAKCLLQEVLKSMKCPIQRTFNYQNTLQQLLSQERSIPGSTPFKQACVYQKKRPLAVIEISYAYLWAPGFAANRFSYAPHIYMQKLLFNEVHKACV